MKVSISMELGASLAAYLRQAQLSLHRADSMAQLADFFHSRSVPPTVVSGALCREVPDFIRSAPVDWPALFERADSEIHRALSKLRSVFGSKSKASVRMDELSSALVVLESLADLLSGRALLSQSEISDVRLKLRTPPFAHEGLSGDCTDSQHRSPEFLRTSDDGADS